jgi:hypothetical protein
MRSCSANRFSDGSQAETNCVVFRIPCFVDVADRPSKSPREGPLAKCGGEGFVTLGSTDEAVALLERQFVRMSSLELTARSWHRRRACELSPPTASVRAETSRGPAKRESKPCRRGYASTAGASRTVAADTPERLSTITRAEDRTMGRPW